MYFEDYYSEVDPFTESLFIYTGKIVLFAFITALIISLILVISWWKIFKKFGKPGWYAIIPLLNGWTMLEIAGFKGWLCLIPFVNIVYMFYAMIKISKKCGKSTIFTVCLMLFPVIFSPILAFSKCSIDSNSESYSSDYSSGNDYSQNNVSDIEQNYTTQSSSYWSQSTPQTDNYNNQINALNSYNNTNYNESVVEPTYTSQSTGESIYSTPSYNQPSTPSYNQPSTPSYNQPSTPSYNQPSTPSYNQPSTPSYNQPSTPSYNQPSTPSYNQPMNDYNNRSIDSNYKRCPNCGGKVTNDAQVCFMCGKNL